MYEEVKNELKATEESKVDISDVINNVVSENLSHHGENYKREMGKRAEIREQRRLEAIAKEERRTQRAIAKKKRLEQERRLKLRGNPL